MYLQYRCTQPIIGHFPCSFLSLSISLSRLYFLFISLLSSSLQGKLGIGVNVYPLSHATCCHSLTVYLQSHRGKETWVGFIIEVEKRENERRETRKRRGGWFKMRGTWRPDNHLFCSPPPVHCLLNHHLLQRKRERGREEGCSVIQEGGSKRVWKRRLKRKELLEIYKGRRWIMVQRWCTKMSVKAGSAYTRMNFHAGSRWFSGSGLDGYQHRFTSHC